MVFPQKKFVGTQFQQQVCELSNPAQNFLLRAQTDIDFHIVLHQTIEITVALKEKADALRVVFLGYQRPSPQIHGATFEALNQTKAQKG